MKKYLLILLLVIFPFTAFAADKKETAYERVMRTNTLRCGYLVWPPFMDKDAKTGKFSGMNYEYTEAVAKSLGLKVEWAVEVTSGEQIEALRTNKIDAICTAEGPLVPATAKYLHYSDPFGYFPFFLYVRIDDTRFDNDLNKVNSPDVRVAVIDGDASGFVANTHFPKAVRYALPQFASPGQMMLDVAANKADVVINDPFSMANYFNANPGKMKQVTMQKPIVVVPNTFSVLLESGSSELITLLNQGIANVRRYGEEDLIFAPYQKIAPNGFYRVGNPWQKDNKE